MGSSPCQGTRWWEFRHLDTWYDLLHIVNLRKIKEKTAPLSNPTTSAFTTTTQRCSKLHRVIFYSRRKYFCFQNVLGYWWNLMRVSYASVVKIDNIMCSRVRFAKRKYFRFHWKNALARNIQRWCSCKLRSRRIGIWIGSSSAAFVILLYVKIRK
jgi:hypothetical protein